MEAVNSSDGEIIDHQEDVIVDDVQSLSMKDNQITLNDRLLHHCLPIANLKLLEGIVLIAAEGPSILTKMAYFENESFQRYQLFPSQFIISGMEFQEYPCIECGSNPMEWYKKTDKPFDYIYIGFVWAGSTGTVIRITRSKTGTLKLLESNSNGQCSNTLLNLGFIPVASKWLKGGTVLALLSVLNYVVFYERIDNHSSPESFTNLRETGRVKCSKSETLFSGQLFENAEGGVKVFAGTVFNGICVWDIVENQAVIKNELKCHDGIIFSLEYIHDRRLLLSTSDDRTVAVWKFVENEGEEQVTLFRRFYGHDARVWKAICVQDFVISVGESSDVKVHCLEDGKQYKSWKAHDGSPIFTCAYDADVEIFYTGGSEGSVRKWSHWLHQLEPRILPFDAVQFEDKSRLQGSGRWIGNKDFPKSVILFDFNHVLVSMESGRVIGLSWNGKQFDLLYDESCEGYQIIKMSPDHETLAIAGSDGHLYTAAVCVSQPSDKDVILYAKKLFKTRVAWNILSMIWVSSSRLLVICFNKAIAIIFQNDKNGEKTEAQLIQTFNLNLQRPGIPAAVEIMGKHVVLGDESGTLHLFRYHKTNDAICKFENWHKDGITDILVTSDEQSLYTSGRDGKIRKFAIRIDPIDDTKAEFISLASYPLPYEWVSGLYFNIKYDQMLISGFYKEHFVIYSFSEKRSIAKIPCGGGGNRKWDFKYGTIDSPNAAFAFVKDKEICYTFLPMTGYLNITMKEGLHGRTINCGIQLKDNGSQSCIPYITGSEDGTLRLFQWDRQADRISCHQNMENHVSSVRSIWKITLDRTTMPKTFIFTGGGKSQLCIYELDAENNRLELLKEIILVKTSSKQTEGDVRIMDICGTKLEQDELCVFGACSDGFIRVLHLNTKTYKFRIAGILNGNSHAVMKIEILKTDLLTNDVIICGVTSNGYVIFWKWMKTCSELCPGKQKMIPVQKDPEYMRILRRTAFLTMKIVEGKTNQQYFIICGGDDCSLSFWDLRLNSVDKNAIQFEIHERWTRDQTQRGSVVGVDLRGDTLFSLSNDQIIGFWSTNGELKRKVHAGVSDCQGFVVDKANDHILCFGKGVSWVPIS